MSIIKLPKVGISGPAKKPKGPTKVNWRSPQLDGLDAWWPCDISFDRTEIRELIRSNDLTLQTGHVGAVTSSIISGDSCPSFDGSTDFQTSINNTPLSGNSDFTCSGWVRVRGAGSGSFQPLIGWGTGAFNGDRVYFCPVGSGVGTIFIGWTGSGQASSSSPYTTGDWFHFVWIRSTAGGTNNSQTGNTVLINGSSIGLTNVAGAVTPVTTANTPYYIVQSPLGTGAYDFFDLRVYSKALTLAQAWQLYDPSTRYSLWHSARSQLTLQGGVAQTFNKSLSDTVHVTDVLSQGQVKNLSDSVTITDSIAKTFGKALTDTFSPVDSLVKTFTKVLTDAPHVTDSITTGTAHVLNLNDSVTPTDTRKFNFTRAITDAISPVDAFSQDQSAIRNFFDAVTVTDRISFGIPTVGFLATSADSGSVAGGTPFTLVGAGLSMSGVTENFASGVLDPTKMAASTTGSGHVTVIAAPSVGKSGALQFDTGATANSQAVVKTVGAMPYSDVEITCAVPESGITTPASATLTASLGLVNPSTTDLFRLSLSLQRTAVPDRYTASVTVFMTTHGGATTVVNRTVKSGLVLSNGSSTRLRVLYANGRTIAYVGGAVVFDSPTGIGDNVIEMRAANDVSISSRLLLTVSKYVRLPVVLFESLNGTTPAYQPATLTFVNSARIDGVSPPASQDQTVSLFVFSSLAALTLPKAWTYRFDPALLQVSQGTVTGSGALTLVSDNIITLKTST